MYIYILYVVINLNNLAFLYIPYLKCKQDALKEGLKFKDNIDLPIYKGSGAQERLKSRNPVPI